MKAIPKGVLVTTKADKVNSMIIGWGTFGVECFEAQVPHSFSKVYSCLVNKVEKKGRTKDEVDEVIFWLTGYDKARLQVQLAKDVDYRAFFEQAPHMNNRADKITGSICGIRVETIENPLMKHIRQLDKLIDDLSKGIPMYKVLRMDPSEYPVYEFDA